MEKNKKQKDRKQFKEESISILSWKVKDAGTRSGLWEVIELGRFFLFLVNVLKTLPYLWAVCMTAFCKKKLQGSAT